MDFKNKIVIVTGGAQGIGRCIAEEFEKLGATVCVIDKQQGDHFVGDLADKQVLEQFAKEVIAQHGHVDYLINNALPLMKGINECSHAPCLVARLAFRIIDKGVAESEHGLHAIDGGRHRQFLFEFWYSDDFNLACC